MTRKIIWFMFPIFLLSCASSKTIRLPQNRNIPEIRKKAEEHYLNGALYDFQDLYEKALLEYYQALLYDSTSAQIYKAIGRDLMRTSRLDAAVEYLKRGLKYDPDDKELLYYLAESYFNLKNFQSAIVFFERLWQLDPYNQSVQNNLLYLYSQTGQDDKLLVFREKLVELNGYDFESTLQLLSLYLKSKRTAEAKKLVSKFQDVHPQDPRGWFLLGNIYEMEQDTIRAIQHYRKALQMDPENPRTQIQLYRLYRDREDWQGLVDAFSEVVRQDSLDYRARLLLAEGLFYLRKYPEAKKILRPVIDNSEFRVDAFQMLGRIAADEKNYSEAESFFDKIIKEEPKNKYAWLYLSILYNQQGQTQKALKTLQDAISMLPEDPDLLGYYGSLLMQQKKYQEALAPLEKAYQLDNRNLNNIVSLGALYEELQMWAEEDSLYLHALEIFPDEAILLNNYSYSLSVRGIRLDEALELALKALSQEPENGAYLDTVGWIYFKMGNYEKALEYISKAVSLREDSAVVIEHLGDVYYKLGDFTQAKKYWQQALEKEPDNLELKKKLGEL